MIVLWLLEKRRSRGIGTGERGIRGHVLWIGTIVEEIGILIKTTKGTENLTGRGREKGTVTESTVLTETQVSGFKVTKKKYKFNDFYFL